MSFIIRTAKKPPTLPSADPNQRESVPPIPPAPREREADGGQREQETAHDPRRERFNSAEGEVNHASS